jgi:signal transduction histidine kinase
MRILRPRPGSGRLRLPRRTARLRLTVLFGAAFLVCGMAVLAIVTSVAFGDTKVGSAGSNGAPAAVFNGKVPAAAVRQAGGTDLVPVPIPVGDIRQEGGYDIVSIRMPVAASRSPAATAAEEAREAAAQVEVNYDERQILIICAIALAVIALAAAAIGWFIAGRVLRPVSTITAAARRIAASSLHERLGLRGPDDELKELGDTLDGLFARLEASFDAQRRFAANASHELRTPLTRERTLLQVTLADPASTTDTWQAVSRELLTSNAEQERLIEALLTLASGEAATGPREPLDLAAISREALAAACPAIKRLDLDVQADIEPAVLDGDPQLVQQLVTNLIDNAARHNIPGGDIQVATTTIGDRAVLSVTNPGQVIPAAEVDRLFQPFQRLGPRSVRRDGGHGLGLSIVRAIATAHGAAITAKPRPGGGLVIKVTFPPPILAQHRRALSTADSGVADGGVSVPRRDLRWPTGH